MTVKNMKLSELSDDKINSLSNADKEKIVYIDNDGGFTTDVGIILGGPEEVILARAEAGLKAYKEGRVKYLVPTGHPDLTCNGETLPEYMHIKKYLLLSGVPESVIVDEPEALTTQENMIYAALRIQRAINFENVKSVMIITSKSHVKRSVALAEEFLPKHLKIYPESTAMEGEERGKWQNYPFFSDRMDAEIWLMKRLIVTGQMKDTEY